MTDTERLDLIERHKLALRFCPHSERWVVSAHAVYDGQFQWARNLDLRTAIDEAKQEIRGLKMKPFNLEKALAGEPVVMRNGKKAYIKYNLLDYAELNSNIKHPLHGFFITERNEAFCGCWTIDGSSSTTSESDYDLIGMWEEPRPKVILTLPCPLDKPQDEMWVISEYEACRSHYGANMDKNIFNTIVFFASESDAQAWLDAMKNSRE